MGRSSNFDLISDAKVCIFPSVAPFRETGIRRDDSIYKTESSMDPIKELPDPGQSPVLGNDWYILLWVVGGLAVLFVGYLLFDAFIVHKRNRRLQQLRRIKKD